jgi:hypothetical protein
MFTKFTGLLTMIFDTLNKLRNTIATLGGGINVIFQEFTERISMFFFQLRLMGIRMKSLFMRLYALLFSAMYLGLSGISGMTSFTNTFLFSFLDTFCFPGETEVQVNENGKPVPKPIKNIQINDVLWPNHIVTGTFKFYSKGQPMVKLGNVVVSTNHYLLYQNIPIRAGNHPHAIPFGTWDSDDLLYCLNTNTHYIPISHFTFLDYDETPIADKKTMNYIEQRINSNQSHKTYPFTEYGFGISEKSQIKTKKGLVSASQLKIGDELTTGSKVVGIIRKQFNEVSTLSNSIQITPSTLYWDSTKNEWKRIGEINSFKNEKCELLSFVVVPNSQIELENNIIVRDYMELCSPDSEIHYANYLESVTK